MLQKDYIQATSILIEDRKFGPIILSATYCPPKNPISKEKFMEYFDTLGPRFIAGGDYNAKHPRWGSKLTTTRGRELQKTMTDNNYEQLSTGQLTYWPTDRNKIPDVLDFFVTKNIAQVYRNLESSLDLSSDHTPVMLTLNTGIICKQRPLSLHKEKTDWKAFRGKIDRKINLKIPLKNKQEIEDGTEYITKLIQDSAWATTPELNDKHTLDKNSNKNYRARPVFL